MQDDPAFEAIKALHKFGDANCDCPRCASLRAVNAVIVNSKLPKEHQAAAQYHIMVGLTADIIGQKPLQGRKMLLDQAIDNLRLVYDHSLTKQGKGN
jgi:hypothetical protein